MTPLEIILAIAATISAIITALVKIQSDRQDRDLAKHNRDLANHKQEIDNQTGLLNGAKLAIDTVTAANSDLRKDLGRSEDESLALRTEREQLRSALQDQRENGRRLDEFKIRFEALTGEISTLRSERDALLVTVGKLTGQLEEQRIAHDNEINRYNMIMEQRIKDLEGRISDLKTQIAERDARISELERKAA